MVGCFVMFVDKSAQIPHWRKDTSAAQTEPTHSTAKRFGTKKVVRAHAVAFSIKLRRARIKHAPRQPMASPFPKSAPRAEGADWRQKTKQIPPLFAPLFSHGLTRFPANCNFLAGLVASRKSFG
jgi:hypothetical protein